MAVAESSLKSVRVSADSWRAIQAYAARHDVKLNAALDALISAGEAAINAPPPPPIPPVDLSPVLNAITSAANQKPILDAVGTLAKEVDHLIKFLRSMQIRGYVGGLMGKQSIQLSVDTNETISDMKSRAQKAAKK